MFENTLLILKSDFISGRKCLLLHLLSKGFQIQGNRKLAFTPEDAAEFYQDLSEDKCYMLYVILLSKGTSEAFILTKEHATEELLDTMICYFGTSVEMDRNVHVSRNARAARREITFIFPNYIHDPIDYFDKHTFSKQPVIASLISEAYNIIKKPIENQHENWRLQLSEWLLKDNQDFPEILNQCSHSPTTAVQEKYQQTDLTMMKGDADDAAAQLSMSSTSTPIGALSNIMSSSSCVSCSSFRSASPSADKAQLDEFEKRLRMRAKKTMKQPTTLIETAKTLCDDQVELFDTFGDCDRSESLEDDTNKLKPEEIVFVQDDLPASVSEDIEQKIHVEELPPAQVAIIEEAPHPMAVAEERPPAEGEKVVVESKPSEKEKGKDELKEVVPKPEPLESVAEPASVQPAATSEPASAQPAATSEPASAQPVVTSEPASAQPAATSEPASAQPAAKSEPASAQPAATSEPASAQPAATSEPASAQPAATSEPTSAQPAATSEPASAQPAATSEPTSAQPAATSEPTSAQPGASEAEPQ